MEVISKSCQEEIPNSCSESRQMSYGGGEGVLASAHEDKEHKGLDIIKKEDKPANGDNSQLSSSRWTTLTRVFHLGLAYEDVSDNRKSLDTGKSQPQLTDIQKGGSLGKMFRQGLGSLSRPGTATEVSQNKKGSLWKFLRPGKSLQYIEDTQEPKDHIKSEEQKSSINKALRTGNIFKQGSSGEKYSDMHNMNNSLQPANMRGRSLGRFFRQHKDRELTSLYATTYQNKSENEKLKMQPVSEEILNLTAESGEDNGIK